MSKPIDVLAALDCQIACAGDLTEMREAVAELIAAATEYYDDNACEYPSERLEAAIARIGAEL